MVLYRCKCTYECKIKSMMVNHLNRQKSCTIDKDMTLINVESLLVEGYIRQDLSHLTPEEKNERRRKRSTEHNTKSRSLGQMTIERFSKQILNNMINHSLVRNHKKPDFTVEYVIQLLQNTNEVYTVTDTVLGDIIFPMKLTNGYYNSASFDKIDDSLGYIESNIEIRPYFLNTNFKFTTQMLKDIVKIREQNQDEQELIHIVKNVNLYTFFYNLAYSIKKRENKRKIFCFENTIDCAIFLINKFIEQGGRCAYSQIPIYPRTNNPYKISPERLDPSGPYSRENIILIAVGLNGAPSGQFLNSHLTEEQQQIALKIGKFNQEYWDKCTKMTPKIYKKCEEVREYGEKILLENLSKKNKSYLY